VTPPLSVIKLSLVGKEELCAANVLIGLFAKAGGGRYKNSCSLCDRKAAK
jgi:hypothetical protein